MDNANKDIIGIITDYDQGVAQVKQGKLQVEAEIKEEQQNEKLMLQGALAASEASWRRSTSRHPKAPASQLSDRYRS